MFFALPVIARLPHGGANKLRAAEQVSADRYSGYFVSFFLWHISSNLKKVFILPRLLNH